MRHSSKVALVNMQIVLFEQLLLYLLCELSVMDVHHTRHLQYFLGVEVLSQPLHDSLIEQEIAAVVHELHRLQQAVEFIFELLIVIHEHLLLFVEVCLVSVPAGKETQVESRRGLKDEAFQGLKFAHHLIEPIEEEH